MNEWNLRALEILINMLPPDRRPRLLRPYTDPQFSGHNIVCDRILVTPCCRPHPVDGPAQLGARGQWNLHWHAAGGGLAESVCVHLHELLPSALPERKAAVDDCAQTHLPPDSEPRQVHQAHQPDASRLRLSLCVG